MILAPGPFSRSGWVLARLRLTGPPIRPEGQTEREGRTEKKQPADAGRGKETKRAAPRRGDGTRKAREDEKGGGGGGDEQAPAHKTATGKRKNPRSEPQRAEQLYKKLVL